jgi:hypothetical protein
MQPSSVPCAWCGYMARAVTGWFPPCRRCGHWVWLERAQCCCRYCVRSYLKSISEDCPNSPYPRGVSESDYPEE